MPILKLNDYVVPRGIRFISELGTDFRFYKFPVKCIINKQLPGCGFTEYCLRGPENVILCSPRKMLLKNKKDQHKDSVYLVVNELEKELTVDKDLSKIDKTRSQVFMDTLKEVVHGKDTVYNRLMNEIKDYLNERKYLGDKPCKILVTYDSYRIVKDILEKIRIFDRFVTVVDEFQSILHDARFKSNTELSFLTYLAQSPTAYFVSATPMMDEYLEMLDEFKDLPYYELDWYSSDSSRIIKPSLKILTMKSVGTKAEEVIQKYLNNDFEEITVMKNGVPTRIVSDEAVFYVNSVNHIISMIKKNNLTPEQCNILCSNTEDNAKRIKRKLGKSFTIGEVPLKGVKPKMFTFCTRTVYLGADFYSLCARSFIFSDSNSDCLAVDIAEDLPQILGRQRLFDNPWKNSATFYYRTTADYREMKKEDFQNIIDSKNKSTESLLSAYNTVLDKDKYDLAKTYQYVAKSANYRDNYIAVNKVINSQTGDVILKPVINQLVLVNEIRAFQIQQVDYKDRFSVFSSVHSKLTPDDIVNRDVTRFFCIYDTLTTMHDKLKMLCEYNFISDIELNIVLGQIADSDEVKSYYLALGPKKLKALTYSKTYIKKELGIVTFSKELLINTITLNFNSGEKYSLSDLKVKLGNLYNSINYDATPKASDIENYFDVKSVVMYEKKEDGTRKQIRGYELLKRK